ncbi:MAG: DUF2214 family protein [bacterium]
MRIPLAVLHLLALGIGFGAVYSRGRALNRLGTNPDALRRAFAADAWWGIAAVLWIGTGLWRALAGTEKASSYYWSNHVFYAKMGLLALVLVLEIWPMVTLIRWRVAKGRTLPSAAELGPIGRRLARVCDVQLLLIIAIVVAATMMARGYGASQSR